MSRPVVASRRNLSGNEVGRHLFEPRGRLFRRNECRHCYLVERTHRLYDREYGSEWWTEAKPLRRIR